jgi:protein-tyrosine phosphatase
VAGVPVSRNVHGPGPRLATIGPVQRPGQSDDQTFRVLFVCTGNMCRSPFAEILTRHILGVRAVPGFEVASAGVGAVVGAQIHPATRDELAPWGLQGVAADRFVARQLRSSMVESAHLVLGATGRHRSAVVEHSPSGRATTFSIREFARLAAAVDPDELPEPPVERAMALVAAAHRRRATAEPSDPMADAVPDPIGGPQAAHHSAAVLIAEAVQTIVDVIDTRS